MANTKISALTAASAALAAHEFPVNESTTSKKVTLGQVAKLIRPWSGLVAAAYGDGDPNQVLLSILRGGTLTPPTPTNITISVARVSYFRLSAALTVNKVRFFGIGAVTSLYKIAIYNGDSLARLSADTAFTTAASTWGSVYSALGLTLAAGQLYFIAVAVSSTGTTAGIHAFTTTPALTGGLLNVAPKSWPGNLVAGSAILPGYLGIGLGQAAVTSGALPDPFPTVSYPVSWTGGMPAFFLDNSNA